MMWVVLLERPLLVLCDLEGVLMDIQGESARHRLVYEAAVGQICGLSVHLGPRDGHTDFTLLCEALEDVGMADTLTAEAFDLIAACATELYEYACPTRVDDGLRLGVAATLTELKALSWVQVVPCSGLVAGIARLLIERAGIEGSLAVGYGAFAEYGRTRPDLIEAARERAAGTGVAWPADKTVQVSRSASDIIAARSVGVRTIAVNCPQAPADAHVPLFERVPAVLARWR